MATFIVIAFATTYSIELLLYILGGLNVWCAPLILLGVMFMPSLAAIFVLKAVTRESLRAPGLRVGVKRHYAYAYALPALSLALGLLIVALFNTAPIGAEKLLELLEGMPMPSGYKHLALMILIVNMAVAPFVNFIPALGEEYGWRGFLLMKLMRYGYGKALLATGLVWGLWHAPVILMGYNYPHHPDIVGVATFTAWCMLWGFLLGWLRMKSGSVFPAALCHGAINAHLGLGLLIAPADELHTIPLGWPSLVALSFLALLAYMSLRKTLNSRAGLFSNG